MNSDIHKTVPPGEPALRVRELTKGYSRRGTPWKHAEAVAAATNVSFELLPGHTMALVGSSGSGKSTVARCVTRLEKPDAGEIWLDGCNIAEIDGRDLFPFRAKCQMVFQDAATSINPRFTAGEVIEEPLRVQKQGDKHWRRNRVMELMQEVGLSSDWSNRRALEFSGGQRQRLAIARAIALKPKLLVLDEALSGLDLSTEAQIANLLLQLQAAHHLAYLLISHDLALVARMADRIAVMAGGTIVEQGPTEQLMATAAHAEMRNLLAVTKSAQAKLSAVLGCAP
jgi:ABC-type glutathione transport system ATPase component